MDNDRMFSQISRVCCIAERYRKSTPRRSRDAFKRRDVSRCLPSNVRARPFLYESLPQVDPTGFQTRRRPPGFRSDAPGTFLTRNRMCIRFEHPSTFSSSVVCVCDAFAVFPVDVHRNLATAVRTVSIRPSLVKGFKRWNINWSTNNSGRHFARKCSFRNMYGDLLDTSVEFMTCMMFS